MELRNQNSQPQNAGGIQSAFTEVSVMPEQCGERGEESAIKRRIWEKVCERLNQLEREQAVIRVAQRGKNGT